MQLQVLWQFELSFVPSRPIDDHDDIVLRVAAGDFRTDCGLANEATI